MNRVDVQPGKWKGYHLKMLRSLWGFNYKEMAEYLGTGNRPKRIYELEQGRSLPRYINLIIELHYRLELKEQENE